MNGRRRMTAVRSPHPLADGLPGIFQPLLTRKDAELLRALAAGAPPRAEDEARVQDAHARLGLLEPTPAEAAERASEDDFLARVCDGFDDLLAPVFLTLDSLETLVDPALAPSDFLGWLGSWLSLRDRTDWPEESWRQLIAQSAGLYRQRGTADALQRTLELYCGGTVTIEETGGYIEEGHTAPSPRLVVRIRGARRPPTDVTFRRGVETVVMTVKPVHVPHEVVWEDA